MQNHITGSIRRRIESLVSALNIIRNNTVAVEKAEQPVAIVWQDVDEIIAAIQSKIRADIFTTWKHAGDTFLRLSSAEQLLNFEQLSIHLDIVGFKYLPADNAKEMPEFVADENGEYNFDDAERVEIWTIFHVTQNRSMELITILKPYVDKMLSDCIEGLNSRILAGDDRIIVGLFPHSVIDKFKGYPVNEFGLISFLVGQSFVMQQQYIERYIDSPAFEQLRAMAKMNSANMPKA